MYVFPCVCINTTNQLKYLYILYIYVYNIEYFDVYLSFHAYTYIQFTNSSCNNYFRFIINSDIHIPMFGYMR